MDISSWVPITREDHEIVGYLEPLDEAYDLVCPRTVLGHQVTSSCEYMHGEELLLELGISDLAGQWTLRDAPSESTAPLAILEVCAHGIVLADALLTKALAPTEKIIVPWPDTAHKLIPYPQGN